MAHAQKWNEKIFQTGIRFWSSGDCLEQVGSEKQAKALPEDMMMAAKQAKGSVGKRKGGGQVSPRRGEGR